MYPALAVVAEIRKHGTEPAEFLYLGRGGAIEERLTQRALIPFQSIQAGGIRGLSPWTAARNLWRLIKSTGRARAAIRAFKPHVTFVTGGYVSAPAIWASAAEHIPSVVYLPDLEPGWAVRVTSRWADRVAISFPEVARHFAPGKTVVTGYPVRAEFFQTDRARARRIFHLDPDIQTVTIFGGSSGAHHINQAALINLVELTRLAQVIHLTGPNDEAWVNEEVGRLPGDLRARVRVYGYLDDELPDALSAADIVVARAGAATLGEFPALGLPAVLVPGPFAGLHQERNARFLVERGAAMQVDDSALSAELIPTLRGLFDAPEQLQKMSAAMRALAQPCAPARIAELLRSMAGANA